MFQSHSANNASSFSMFSNY